MSADDMLPELSRAVGRFHFVIFLYGAVFCGILFGVWQLNYLEQPWYRGPWHIAFFGWLAIYVCYAGYAADRDKATEAAQTAASSELLDSDKLVWWYDRTRPHDYKPPWWLVVPYVLLTWLIAPLLLCFAALLALYRVATTPSVWPEAGACIAAVVGLIIVPTYGPGPLLVTAAHVATVVWLRSSRSMRRR